MAYTSGMLRHRITIQNRADSTSNGFGRNDGGVIWSDTCTVWAAVDFVKGLRSMYEGALDVYGVVMVRCRFTEAINVRSRIVYEGQVYNILGDTLHIDYLTNTIQFNAQLVINEGNQE